MKNVLLALFFTSTVFVGAQNHLLGIKGGINWANSAGKLSSNSYNDFKTCFSAGLTYDFIFKKHFSVGADFLYSQRGFRNKMNFADNNGNVTEQAFHTLFHYDYLSIPIKVGFNYGEKFYVFANIGLAPSFLVNASTTVPNIETDAGTIPSATSNTTRMVNKFDIAGFAELGGGYKFGQRYWLYASFAFQHSFMSISNQNYFANSKIVHYRMSLSIGLKCALTK